MQLAILGTDDDVLALTRAALAAGHTFAWLGDVRDKDAQALANLLPELTVARDWESLLGSAVADAVLVGRGTESDLLRAEQLKRLVSDAVPLLVVHPTGLSVLPYYELDMNRGEVHGVLRHYHPLAELPLVAELAASVASGDSETGPVHQVVCQRHVNDFGRRAVLAQLARDVELLRSVAGAIRSVSTVGPKSRDASYASLQVQMTTAGTTTLRWSVAPLSNSQSDVELTLIGEQGTREACLPTSDSDVARVAIDDLAAAVGASGSERSEAASTWHDATAAMEVLDAIELSLEKGRTIEVLPQRLTERLAFRGTMSALGCGLLLLVPLVLIVSAVLGNAIGLVQINFWPLAILLLLVVFLLLQVIPAMVRKQPPAAAEDEPT